MTTHSCKPPAKTIKRWLKQYPSEDGNYGHLLLEQKCDCDDDLISELVPYFESAHGDARTYFHEQVGIDLHPDADDTGSHATYPTCLPPITRRGIFGEVMAGLLAEYYPFIGKHKWTIPIFLFRFHEDAEHCLFDLARDSERKREIYGRRGSDFLALALDDEGEVVRFIVGEAKWRKLLQPSVVNEVMYGKNKLSKKTGKMKNDGKGVWAQINKAPDIPLGLRQLQRLLRERAPDQYSAAILSLDKVLVVRDPVPLPKTNLILLSGNDVPSRKTGYSLIHWKEMPEEYEADHDLQVVELILDDGDKLIDGIYDTVWAS